MILSQKEIVKEMKTALEKASKSIPGTYWTLCNQSLRKSKMKEPGAHATSDTKTPRAVFRLLYALESCDVFPLGEAQGACVCM